MKKMSTAAVAQLGLLGALCMTLSFLETLLPPLPFLPPGFKLGLANIAVMYALLCGGLGWGFCLCALKALFTLGMSGGLAFLLSLAGSLLSVLVMAGLMRLFGLRISYAALSVSGALCHNAAQLFVVTLIADSPGIFYYAPVLVLAALLCGCATAALVRLLMPYYRKYTALFSRG